MSEVLVANQTICIGGGGGSRNVKMSVPSKPEDRDSCGKKSSSCMEMEHAGSNGGPSVAAPKQPVAVRLPPISSPDQRLTPLLHNLIEYGELPGFSPFTSPRHSAKKRPLSISPSLSSAPSIESIVRMSPAGSLLTFMNAYPGSGSRISAGGGRTSREGSMGHLTPAVLLAYRDKGQSQMESPLSPIPSSLASSNPPDHQEPQQLQSLPCTSQIQQTSLPTAHHQDEEAMEDICTATTKLEVLYEQPEPTDSISKQERVARKGQYYSYPLLEEPHNDRCLWQDCNKQFSSLPELVAHLNTVHIHHESRKEFVCKWRGCIRKQEPFKAQYMLLVHMRRHTGEKPHKCDVSVGCTNSKAALLTRQD